MAREFRVVLVIFLILLGLSGFSALEILARGIRPPWFAGWEVMIASISGGLLGVGLGGGLDVGIRRNERLSVSGPLLWLGLLFIGIYIALATEIVPFKAPFDVGLGLGVVFAAAGLSGILAHRAKQPRNGKQGERGVWMKSMLGVAKAPLHWWRSWRHAKRRVETTEAPRDYVYRSTVVQDSIGFLFLEMEWQQVALFLKRRGALQGLAFSPIIVSLDTSQIEAPIDILLFNPTVRVTKGRRAITVPARLRPIPNSENYMLQIRSLTLVHLERYFKFNFITWPVANVLPLCGAAVILVGWGAVNGWDIHQSDDFLPVIGVTIGVTALVATLWRLVVQESEKRFDNLCRRLELELMSSNMDTLASIMRNIQAAFQEQTGRPP